MTSHPANWYPDPQGRHEHRYYDGNAWTDHVSDNGQPSIDPLNGSAPSGAMDKVDSFLTVGDEGNRVKIAQQLTADGYRGAGLRGVVGGGTGSVFDEPVLVVNQKAKLIELNNQYSVFDQQGNKIAAVNQVGQSTAKKVLRMVSSLDQFMTHKLQVTDASGQVLMQLTRPRKVFKSTVVVSDANDREIGRIVQEKMIGKINFSLESNGQRLGGIFGENWRAWNFRIEDASGTEVARITKTFEGVLKTAFTTADNYVVQKHSQQPEPLNTLIVASALSVDTALKQDARGFG
ncbi:phospholipid scramblase-related protein [Desertimonas flava]|jgi:uncharacterized protein YxjI|uniref:phospholipid scramblase-related protein n=1 Tax=Desertimonas flava TaxID=2064846 RepID=UPI000E3441A7|nr:phospholipid scramblase-related protein [Desertimonas flava]